MNVVRKRSIFVIAQDETTVIKFHGVTRPPATMVKRLRLISVSFCKFELKFMIYLITVSILADILRSFAKQLGCLNPKHMLCSVQFVKVGQFVSATAWMENVIVLSFCMLFMNIQRTSFD